MVAEISAGRERHGRRHPADAFDQASRLVGDGAGRGRPAAGGLLGRRLPGPVAAGHRQPSSAYDGSQPHGIDGPGAHLHTHPREHTGADCQSGAPSHRHHGGAPSHRHQSGAPSHRHHSGAPSHRHQSGARPTATTAETRPTATTAETRPTATTAGDDIAESYQRRTPFVPLDNPVFIPPEQATFLTPR